MSRCPCYRKKPAATLLLLTLAPVAVKAVPLLLGWNGLEVGGGRLRVDGGVHLLAYVRLEGRGVESARQRAPGREPVPHRGELLEGRVDGAEVSDAQRLGLPLRHER